MRRSAWLWGSVLVWGGASCVGPAPMRATDGSGGATTTAGSGGDVGTVGGGGQGGGGRGCGDTIWDEGEVCYGEPIIFTNSGNPRPRFARLDMNGFHDIVMLPVGVGIAPIRLRLDDGAATTFQGYTLGVPLTYFNGDPIAVGDFDGDGLDDLLLKRSETAPADLEHWSNNGTVSNNTMQFTDPQQASLSVGGAVQVVEALSLDDDGQDDAVVVYCKVGGCTADSALDIYPFDGGAFIAEVSNQTMTTMRVPVAVAFDSNGQQPGVLAVVGIDTGGSGRLELFSVTNDSTVAVTGLGNAAGVTVTNPRDVAVGQLDGAQGPDVVITSGDEEIAIIFDLSNPVPQRIDVGVAARQVELVDMDADGDLDIVLGQPGQIRWLPNDGTGNFGPLRPLGMAGDSNEYFDVADINGDMAPDFVTFSPSSNGTSVFLSAP